MHHVSKAIALTAHRAATPAMAHRALRVAASSNVAMPVGLTTAALLLLPAATTALSALATAARHRALLPTVAHPAWVHVPRVPLAFPVALPATTAVVTASLNGALRTAATASAPHCGASSHRVARPVHLHRAQWHAKPHADLCGWLKKATCGSPFCWPRLELNV
jgi:hypothetical protein